MFWYPPGPATEDKVDRGVREIQRALNEAMVALSAAENQLAACIERVKEHRQSVEHDELVLSEVLKNLKDILKAKVTKAKEYDSLRKSVREVRKALTQRRSNWEAARTAVDKAEDDRDALLQKVSRLKTRLEKYQTVIPWKKP